MIAKKKSTLEESLAGQLDDAGIPYKREFRFFPSRRWAFDFAFPEIKLAVECEGGTFGAPVRCHNCGSMVMRKTKRGFMPVREAGGRHTRGSGYQGDLEKYNTATLESWRLLRFDKTSILNGTALSLIVKALNGEIK